MHWSNLLLHSMGYFSQLFTFKNVLYLPEYSASQAVWHNFSCIWPFKGNKPQKISQFGTRELRGDFMRAPLSPLHALLVWAWNLLFMDCASSLTEKRDRERASGINTAEIKEYWNHFSIYKYQFFYNTACISSENLEHAKCFKLLKC